jgi:hypothetical protein
MDATTASVPDAQSIEARSAALMGPLHAGLELAAQQLAQSQLYQILSMVRCAECAGAWKPDGAEDHHPDCSVGAVFRVIRMLEQLRKAGCASERPERHIEYDLSPRSVDALLGPAEAFLGLSSARVSHEEAARIAAAEGL